MKHNRIGLWLLVCPALTCSGLVVLSHLSAQEQKERTTLRGHTKPVRSVAFSPDGKTLASGSEDSTIKLWEVTTGKERAILKGHTSSVFAVVFSPDGKTLASGSSAQKGTSDDTIKLWDVATGKERATLKGHRGNVWSVVY